MIAAIRSLTPGAVGRRAARAANFGQTAQLAAHARAAFVTVQHTEDKSLHITWQQSSLVVLARCSWP